MGNKPVVFQRATKRQIKLRMAIDGPSGSGKTMTGLILAFALTNGGGVGVIDTEHGSASKYADMFPEYQTVELDEFSPQNYIDSIHAAEQAGFNVILIDSLSHAWEGKGGVLEMHDMATKRSSSHDGFAAWRDVNPAQLALVEAMLNSKCHVIATMRSKTDYVVEKNERTGKNEVRKVGMAPVQRQGIEYEFDVTADMDLDNTLVASKSRCFAFAGKVIAKPKAGDFKPLIDWLNSGEAARPAPEHKPDAAPAQTSTSIKIPDGWSGFVSKAAAHYELTVPEVIAALSEDPETWPHDPDKAKAKIQIWKANRDAMIAAERATEVAAEGASGK